MYLFIIYLGKFAEKRNPKASQQFNGTRDDFKLNHSNFNRRRLQPRTVRRTAKD